MVVGPRSSLSQRLWIGASGSVALLATVFACQARGQTPAATPPTPVAGFVGSQPCVLCHSTIAAGWSKSAHGVALASPSLPAASQGCEACHGPGSVHAGSTGKQKLPDPTKLSPAEIEAMCGKCHLPGESPAPLSPVPVLDASAWRLAGHRGEGMACTSCHKMHGGGTSTLVAPAEGLCLSCHDDLTKSDHGRVHAPVKAGQCLVCHGPHGSSRPHGLRAEASRSCEQCHKPNPSDHQDYQVAGSDCVRCHDPHSFDADSAYLRKVAHPPFGQRNCKLCHTPPPYPKLSAASAAEVCSTCHGKQGVATGDSAVSGIHTHAPVAAGLCTKCHEPHVSDTPAGLADSPAAVCTACHRRVGTIARGAARRHPPVAKGDCLSCHKGHSSVEKALLTNNQADLCKDCHADQSMHAHPTGPEVKDPNTGEPVLCTSCHGVHGSEHPSILRQQETEMCLTCHRMEHLDG